MIKVISIFTLFLILSKIGGNLDGIIDTLSHYDELITLLTSLLLAYVTWRYAYSSQKTLDFMRYSFEKEYEEDIKFMFITIDNNELFIQDQEGIKEAKFIENSDLIRGRDDFDNRWDLDYDSNFVSIRLFNSGRRLISHIKLEYLIKILDDKGDLYDSKKIETIIPKTIQPNDYVSIPLVKVDQLPYIKVHILSLRSFNGLGKEQLENSPQYDFLYRNSNLDEVR